MKKKLLSFHCEINIQRNDISIPLNKNPKSKLKACHLYAYYDNVHLSPIQVPFINICELNSEEQILYKFTILLIKKVMRPFIQEGKITIELIDENTSNNQQTRIINASDMSLKASIKSENSIFVFLSQSTKEMLSHFCHLLSDLHNKFKAMKNDNKNNKPENSINQINQNTNKKTIENEENKHNLNGNDINPNNEGRRKINRSILTQPHQQNPQKRPFSYLNQQTHQEISIKLPPKIENQTSKKLIIGFFNRIPEIIIEKIIFYLPKFDLHQIILINKEFYTLIWRNLKHLNLKSKPEIPPEFLKKFLIQTEILQKLTLGRLKNVSPGFFSDLLTTKLVFHLKIVDMRGYSKTNDKILIKLLQNSKELEIIKLPYISGLTKDSLLTFSTYLKKITYFEINYDGPTAIQHNINITDLSLFTVIESNKNITGFNLAYVSMIFYDNFFKSDFYELNSRIKIIKLTNLVVNNAKSLENLKYLANFTNLEYLKLINLLQKNQYNSYEPLKLDTITFDTITKGCQKLQKVKLGSWLDNEKIMLLAVNLKDLREVSFKNNQEIEDIAMEIFFQVAQFIEKIDISECFRINGHCLEGLASKELKELVVCFGQFNLNCVENLLIDKGLSGVRVINKIAMKK